MKSIAYIMIIFVWFTVVLALATGLFYTENYRIRRKDSPKEFWVAVGTSVLLASAATVLILYVSNKMQLS